MVAPEFIRPMKLTKISDSFEEHKDRKPTSANPGTDYPAPVGTNVVAVASGRVVMVKPNTSGAAGRVAMVDHGHGWFSEYLHLSRVLVRPGDRVKQGQHIAESGASGFGRENFYGAHLHLTVRHGGRFLGATGNRDFEVLLKAQKPKPAPKKVEDLGS